MPGMTKRLGRTNRVEFRLPPDLDAAVRKVIAERGWTITEWGERACRCLLSELAAALGDPATGTGARTTRIDEDVRTGVSPSPADPSKSAPASPQAPPDDGVRPAAPSQAIAPARIAPVRKVKASTASLGNVGPKPLSATKPRPKATKPKGKA